MGEKRVTEMKRIALRHHMHTIENWTFININRLLSHNLRCFNAHFWCETFILCANLCDKNRDRSKKKWIFIETDWRSHWEKRIFFFFSLACATVATSIIFRFSLFFKYPNYLIVFVQWNMFKYENIFTQWFYFPFDFSRFNLKCFLFFYQNSSKMELSHIPVCVRWWAFKCELFV